MVELPLQNMLSFELFFRSKVNTCADELRNSIALSCLDV